MAILALGFTIPTAAERYAEEAAAVKLGGVSVQGFTPKGVNLRVLVDVDVDADRVKNFDARIIGRFGGFLFRKASTDNMNVRLYLPAYGDDLAVQVSVPPIDVNIRNGHSTALNFTTYVELAKMGTVMALVKDALMNKLEVVDVRAETTVKAKAGWFALPEQEITKTLRVDGLKDTPTLPPYKLGDIQVGEKLIDGNPVLNANASLLVHNLYVIGLDIPPLGFTISFPGCEVKDIVAVANAALPPISIVPLRDIDVDVTAVIPSIPTELTGICPGSNLSPMDTFISRYLHGEVSKVYVSGDGVDRPETPSWITEILKDLTVPVPFSGHSMDGVVKKFSMSNFDISLPMPGMDPNSPDSLPLVSADVEVLVALPRDVDIDFEVSALSARANVSYTGAIFGDLGMHEWMPAISEKVKLDQQLYMKVNAAVKNAPLNVTNYDVFQQIVQKILFGERGIDLTVDGRADAEVAIPLGKFIVHDLPAAGNITIDGFPGFGAIPIPKAKDVRVVESTKNSMTLAISASLRNSTPYHAVIPYCNVLVLSGDSVLGTATVKDLVFSDGDNEVTVFINWAPIEYGGWGSVAVAEALISDFISGRSGSLTLRVHDESIPSMPSLSKALSNVSITIPMPALPYLPPRDGQPSDDDDDIPSDDDGSSDGPHFIRSATMHLFTSTADFLIQNPFPHDLITIYKLNGSAMYNGSVLGTMLADFPFTVNPGLEGLYLTPRIPVEWRLDSVGYEAMKKALGGELKVNAVATCNLSLGRYQMTVLYNASRPMKAHVRW
ncbi:hypothetical protein EX30DRAFT_307729 [Ascodesmis nigricans]|uniref:Pre-rRNA processing protein n=1 Tax=Ascodesmis nigricans TaxID=341454 RepID=A0A4S2MVA4_9PEZI|nr:hypothetical protein EX30DRAFT_307729 [Ascodesmis nigricans]